jgi:hypothetical protein
MQTNPEPLPVAKLVELDDACLGLDEKPLADDEPTSFPIDAGELRELLRGYRVQAAFAEREARLVGALGIVGKVLPSAAGLDDAPDSKIIACYMSMGEMRAIKEALAAPKGPDQ